MRSWSINLFSVFGIRLEVHFTFFVFVGLFAWAAWATADPGSGPPVFFWSLLVLLGAFTCLVLHELGHSLAAQYYGIEVIRILLLPIGGMAQFQSLPREAPKELIIAIAGPLVNAALALFLLFLGGIPWEFFANVRTGQFPVVDVRTLIQTLFLVNVIMGFFNLLPIFPMDGGRMLRALLTYRFSYLRATGVAAAVSKVLATAGVLLALFGLPVLGLGIAIVPAILFAFIFFAGDREYRMVERSELLTGFRLGDLLDEDFCSVEPDQPVGAALRMMEDKNARALLVMENDSLFGMLTRDHTAILAEERFLHTDPIGRHCERNVSLLQAQWPLELFYEMLAHNRKKVFPVYSEGRVAGILDTGRLNEKLTELGISPKRLGLSR